ncbi:MAG: PD-(D/E)XK nuclease family protein, partial [Bacillota bacterium]
GKADLPTQVYQALRFLGHLRLSLTPTAADVARLTAARHLQEQAARAATLDELTADEGHGALPGEAVTIMTIHAAKGLQFPTVFLVGLAEGIFPVAVDSAPVFYTAEAIRDWLDGARTSPPGPAERLARHIREERRLAYVALTRAERELILTRARQYGQEPAEPSRFLAELGAPPPERIRLADPLPDARSYLLKVAAGAEPGEPERVAQAVNLLSRDPRAVPLRRQEEPRPFRGDEVLRLSATALEAYKECPRRYYYAQVLRLPDEDNISLAFGDAAHKALERYNRALMAGVQPSAEELQAWWEAALDPTRCQSPAQYHQLLQRGWHYLERYHRWARGRWRRILGVEERFEAPYVDGAGRTHRVTGRYDLIAEAADGALEIIDYKTSKRSSVVNKRITRGSDKNPQAKIQLGLYYLARFGGEADPGARVAYIFLRHEKDELPHGLQPDFDPGEQAIATAHTAESLAAIRQSVDEIIEGILANRFDRTEDLNKCERCPFRHVCEVSPLDWY